MKLCSFDARSKGQPRPLPQREVARIGRALLDELFEHPAGVFHCCATDEDHRSSSVAILFFRSLLVIRVREALFVKALEPGVGGPNQTPTWLSTRLAAVQDPSALAALTERQEEAFFQIV